MAGTIGLIGLGNGDSLQNTEEMPLPEKEIIQELVLRDISFSSRFTMGTNDMGINYPIL